MQVGSDTVGIIIGFGMMLVSGFFLYLNYQQFKDLNDEDKRRWLFWEMLWEATLTFSGGIISLIGVFLLGLLLVVLLTLESLGIIPLG